MSVEMTAKTGSHATTTSLPLVIVVTPMKAADY